MSRGKREAKKSNTSRNILIVIILIVLIAGVGYGVTKLIKKKVNQGEQEQQNVEFEKEITGNKYEIKGKTLIAYFSRTGNTLTVASLINRKIGGEIFKIEPVEAYSYDYNETSQRAQQEKDSNARPELAKKIENIEEYDTIFLGYPIWFDTMPMPVYTFLDTYNLDGKTIIPFCTSSSSTSGTTVTDIENLEPNAKVLNCLSITGSDVGGDNTKTLVDAWIEGIQKEINKD